MKRIKQKGLTEVSISFQKSVMGDPSGDGVAVLLPTLAEDLLPRRPVLLDAELAERSGVLLVEVIEVVVAERRRSLDELGRPVVANPELAADVTASWSTAGWWPESVGSKLPLK